MACYCLQDKNSNSKYAYDTLIGRLRLPLQIHLSTLMCGIFQCKPSATHANAAVTSVS